MLYTCCAVMAAHYLLPVAGRDVLCSRGYESITSLARAVSSVQVAERERSAAVQQLDADAAVTSIIDGLSFAGGTMEALQARAQEPEEWTPQVRI